MSEIKLFSNNCGLRQEARLQVPIVQLQGIEVIFLSFRFAKIWSLDNVMHPRYPTMEELKNSAD